MDGLGNAPPRQSQLDVAVKGIFIHRLDAVTTDAAERLDEYFKAWRRLTAPDP